MRGRRLSDYTGLIFDVCHLTASLTGGRLPAHELATFRELLDAEGIRNAPYTEHPALAKTTVRLHTPMDMHRLLCKLPGGLQTVMREAR